MEALFAAMVGLLTGCGVYLLLRGRTFPVVFGLALLSYATNLFLFAMGRLRTDQAPLLLSSTPGNYADPIPQALVLTAIVIGFAMTAFVVVLAVAARGVSGSEAVDARVEEE